jgi:hypothetical protein
MLSMNRGKDSWVEATHRVLGGMSRLAGVIVSAFVLCFVLAMIMVLARYAGIGPMNCGIGLSYRTIRENNSLSLLADILPSSASNIDFAFYPRSRMSVDVDFSVRENAFLKWVRTRGLRAEKIGTVPGDSQVVSPVRSQMGRGKRRFLSVEHGYYCTESEPPSAEDGRPVAQRFTNTSILKIVYDRASGRCYFRLTNPQ